MSMHWLPEQAIYASLEAGFPGDADAWDLRARRWLTPHAPDQAMPSGDGGSSAEGAALATYERGLRATQGEAMCDRYAAFLAERLEAAAPPPREGDAAPGPLTGRTKQLAKRLLKVCYCGLSLALATPHRCCSICYTILHKRTE
jgi:hypothetical protein